MPVVRPCVALALSLALVACARPPPPQASPEDQARVDKLGEEMLAVARAAEAKRTTAIAAAMDSLVPRTDLGPCPIKVPIVGTEDRAKLGQGEPAGAPVDWRSIRAEQMMVVARPALATEKGVRLKHVEEMIDFEKGRVATEGVAEVEQWLRYYGDLKNASWEMVIVADQRVDPEIVEQNKFREGIILGRAFVYSFVDDAVVCAANVLAKSSDLLTNHKVATQDGKDWGLVFDLENEAFRAAARGLFRAGPGASPGHAGDAGEATDGGSARKKAPAP